MLHPLPIRRQFMFALNLAACGMLVVLAGCGSDDHDVVTPAATSTATPPRMNTPLPTSTPTERPNENIFGSTIAGGGRLTIDQASQVSISLSTCIGGTGDTCEGGTAFYIGTEPGFEEAEDDQPSLPLFHLPDGVPITLQVVAIDAGTKLKFEDVELTTAGQSIDIGTTPGIHQDLEWQLQVPPGGSATGHNVSVKLTSVSAAYGESSTYTLELVPKQGQPE